MNTRFPQPSKSPYWGYDLQWYEVYAAPAKLSIRKISDDIDCGDEYTYFYSSFSRFIHGTDMWKSIAIGDQNLQMHPIREPSQIPEAVRLAATLALRVFRMVIRQYRPDEEENFNRKYLQEWRARFLKEYNVERVPQYLRI